MTFPAYSRGSLDEPPDNAPRCYVCNDELNDDQFCVTCDEIVDDEPDPDRYRDEPDKKKPDKDWFST